jgi:hypothetical protein
MTAAAITFFPAPGVGSVPAKQARNRPAPTRPARWSTVIRRVRGRRRAGKELRT